MTYVLSYTAQQYLNTNDLTGTMQSVILPQYSVPYAIGVSNRADYRLLTILDKAVTNLSDDIVESAILTHTENEKSDLTMWQFFVMQLPKQRRHSRSLIPADSAISPIAIFSP